MEDIKVLGRIAIYLDILLAANVVAVICNPNTTASIIGSMITMFCMFFMG